MTADQAFSAYKARGYFGSLDGLRAFCVGLVLWHHSPALTSLETPWMILTRGFTGVDFFFVLSGYLITTLLIREEARDGRFSLAGFYRRRVLRIVPVYFLVVTVIGAYYVLVKDRWDLAPLLPYYYLFFSNMLIGEIPTLAPTWSLSVEEQFYLLWPLTMLLLPMRAAVRGGLLVGLIVFCVGVSAGIIPWFDPVETTYARWQIPFASFAAILSGALLALVLDSRAGFCLLWRGLRGRWVAPLLGLGLMLSWQALPGVLLGWPNFVMHSVMTLLLAALVVREDHWAGPVLRFAPLRRVGEISYGIYLYHLIGLQFARDLAEPFGVTMQSHPWGVTLAFIGISIAMAEISFRTYERYFLQMKARKARPRAPADHMKKI
jgi:peptidoglycan/LPS O-acetylase OafA/YrhL